MDANGHAIVLCTDGKGSTPFGSKEWMLKIRAIRPGWRFLTAGNDDDIIPVLHLLRNKFRSLQNIDETNIVSAVTSVLAERKQQKADDYTLRKWGMTFADFRKAKAEFPEEEYRSDIASVGLISVGVDGIVAGFDAHGFPLIVQAHGDHGVQIKEDFAVSGSGSYLAAYGLLHRDHYDVFPLQSTIYCVYEAKRYAERVSTVGKTTYLSIMRPGNRFELLTRSGESYLNGQFEKYGPHTLLKNEIALPDGALSVVESKIESA